MSVELVGTDTLGAAERGGQPLASRMIAKTLALAGSAARRIAEEVIYAIREDIRHGRISRDPKDWEQ